MMMHKAFHPMDNIVKFYVTRKGSGLTSIEDCENTMIIDSKNMTKKKNNKEKLLIATSNSNISRDK